MLHLIVCNLSSQFQLGKRIREVLVKSEVILELSLVRVSITLCSVDHGIFLPRKNTAKMPNQPEHAQPGSSRDPPPAAEEQPGQIVPPAVAGDDVEMLQPGALANRPADVAGEGCFSRIARIVEKSLCHASDAVVEGAVQPLQFSNTAEQHARETHRLSNLITRAQCFLLPTSRSTGGDEYLKKALGICVRFKKECDESSCHRCESCGVCPHQYSCSCFDEYKLEGGWCAHIHAMHMLTRGQFQKKLCLYIQTNLSYTAMRHVRAYVQGEKFMKLVDGRYYQGTLKDYEKWWPKVWVKRSSPDDCTCSTTEKCCVDTCLACRCQFECDCSDYLDDKQICQHVHSVAMIRLGAGFEYLDRPVDDLPSTLPDDWNYKYYVELEHEMSFYIDKNRIQEKFGPLSDFMSYDEEFALGAPSNAADFDISESSLACGSGKGDDPEKTPKKEELDKWWVVTRKSKSGNTERQCRVWSNFDSRQQCPCTGENRCRRCKICCHDYTCTCFLHNHIICRHVHAIHRLSTQSQETKAEAARYIEANFNRPAIKEKSRHRPHRPDDSHMPPEAKRTRDVLPPLTD